MPKRIIDVLIRHQGAVSFVLALLLLGALSGLSIRANAQDGLPEGLTGEMRQTPMICGDTKTLYKALKEDHGEDPMVLGFNKTYGAVVWFSNPDRTSLSIVIDTPVRSCLIYSTRCLPGDCFVLAEELVSSPKDELDKLKKLDGVDL